MSDVNKPGPSPADELIQIRDAISNLTIKDYHNLGIAAKMYSIGTKWTPEDLVQEAVVSTMELRRHWNKRVSLVYHLRGAIRSIAHGARLKAAKEHPFPEQTDGDRETEPGPATDLNPERILMAEQTLEQLRRVFANDEEALDFLDLMMNNDATEVKRGLGSDLFRKLTSRIRHELIRQFPELESQVRHKTGGARKSGSVEAYECLFCHGKVLRTVIELGKMRWVCQACLNGFGPIWAEGRLETKLVGIRPWTDIPEERDPAERVHIEFREIRNGETYFVWGEKCGGRWTFIERPATEVRKTMPLQSSISSLTERAEAILQHASLTDPEPDRPSLIDYVKCIIDNNLGLLSQPV